MPQTRCVKTPYANRASAQREIDRLKTRGDKRGRRDFKREPYECEHCRAWHISYPTRKSDLLSTSD